MTSLVGFIVGFAMFGAITYLPAFFQVVRGISPTLSEVYLLPLMAGPATGQQPGRLPTVGRSGPART